MGGGRGILLYLCVANEVFFNILNLASKCTTFSKICVFLCVEVPREYWLEILLESPQHTQSWTHLSLWGPWNLFDEMVYRDIFSRFRWIYLWGPSFCAHNSKRSHSVGVHHYVGPHIDGYISTHTLTHMHKHNKRTHKIIPWSLTSSNNFYYWKWIQWHR